MKKFIVKIKDLPKDFNLVGCKLNGKFIYSGWNKGFWLKENKESSQVKPIFFKNYEEIKDWEIELPPLGESQIEYEKNNKSKKKYSKK